MNRNRDMMMRELQECSFKMYDLHLYLDTHPSEHAAVEEYNATAKKYKSMKEHYEKLYGCIQMDGDEYTTPWKWIEGPWPWQNYDCKKEDKK